MPDYRTSNITGPTPALTLSDPSDAGEACSYHGRKLVGSTEAWICLGCGYTEHYVHGLGSEEMLAELVAKYPHLLRIVDANATPSR